MRVRGCGRGAAGGVGGHGCRDGHGRHVGAGLARAAAYLTPANEVDHNVIEGGRQIRAGTILQQKNLP